MLGPDDSDDAVETCVRGAEAVLGAVSMESDESPRLFLARTLPNIGSWGRGFMCSSMSSLDVVVASAGLLRPKEKNPPFFSVVGGLTAGVSSSGVPATIATTSGSGPKLTLVDFLDCTLCWVGIGRLRGPDYQETGISSSTHPNSS